MQMEPSGREIGMDFNILLIALIAKKLYGESLIVLKAAPSTRLELFSARLSPSLSHPFSVHWTSAQTFDVSPSRFWHAKLKTCQF